MLKNILATGAVIAVLPFFVTPSFALKGIEALDQCVQNTLGGCKITYSGPKGNFVITGPRGELVDCSGLEEECVALTKEAAPKPKRTEYQVPESLTSSGGNSGDTGTGSGSGSGHSFGTSGPGRGPITTHDIQ